MSTSQYDEERRRQRRRSSQSRPETTATTERRLSDADAVADGGSGRRRIGYEMSTRSGDLRSGGSRRGSTGGHRSHLTSSNHQAQRTSSSGRRHSSERKEKDRVAATASSTKGPDPRPVTSREEVIKRAMKERGATSRSLVSDAPIRPMSSHGRFSSSKGTRSSQPRRIPTVTLEESTLSSSHSHDRSEEEPLSISRGGRSPRAHQSTSGRDSRTGPRNNLERDGTIQSARSVMMRELSGLNNEVDDGDVAMPSGSRVIGATRESLRLSPVAECGEGGGGNYQYRGEKRSRRRLVDNNLASASASTSASTSTAASASASGDESGSATPAAQQIINSLLWFKFHAPRCVFDDIMEKCHTCEEEMAGDDERSFGVSRRGSDILSIESGTHYGKRASMEMISRRGSDGMMSTGHSSVSAIPASRKGSMDMLSVASSGTRINRRSSMESVASTGVDRLEALAGVMGGTGRRNSVMGIHGGNRRNSGLFSVTSGDLSEDNNDDLGATCTLTLPHSTRRESALLFVDISGFTKLSTMLDVEELSKAINSYFELIIHEITIHGGDVLKFAGDALFAEWSAVSEDLDLAECTKAAAMCGASIVKKASGFKVYGPKGKGSKNKQVSAGSNIRVRVATLDVHCGLGVGPLTGLHVSNIGATWGGPMQVENRREYLFLGSSINQVAKAEVSVGVEQKSLNPTRALMFSLLVSALQTYVYLTLPHRLFHRKLPKKESLWQAQKQSRCYHKHVNCQIPFYCRRAPPSSPWGLTFTWSQDLL